MIDAVMRAPEIMAAANARGLKIAGIKVRVNMAADDFAHVYIAERGHPLFGWAAEYSWEAIAHAVEGDGVLR